MSEQIQRYVIDGEEMFEDTNGDYVTHADHIAVVEKLEALLREWRNLNCEAPQWQYDDLFERTDELIGEK